MPEIAYRSISPSVVPLAPRNITQYQSILLALMIRNIASDGWVFRDPLGNFSRPGAIIAAPSYPENDPHTDQNYVYNWTRDAAITIFELAEAPPPWDSLADLNNYVDFAQFCQNSGASIARACYMINGFPRAWSNQNDGPALQSLAVLALWPRLSSDGQTAGRAVIASNVSFLLGAYRNPTTNLWEESYGQSFFARSVILRCLQQVLARNDGYGLGLNNGAISSAIADLNNLLQTHWDGSISRYRSIVGGNPTDRGIDLNIDVVMASVYGAIPCTDPKLLSTAAQVRDFFSTAYAINAADNALNIGPMIGRYPGDTYSGDTTEPDTGHGHPWTPCTANFAELYYNLAKNIEGAPGLLTDPSAATFFSQVNISSTTAPSEAANLLRDAGDKMLQALIYHSDHLELSEQYDGTSGYEKSVSDLTWSYAAFLSALRAR